MLFQKQYAYVKAGLEKIGFDPEKLVGSPEALAEHIEAHTQAALKAAKADWEKSREAASAELSEKIAAMDSAVKAAAAQRDEAEAALEQLQSEHKAVSEYFAALIAGLASCGVKCDAEASVIEPDAVKSAIHDRVSILASEQLAASGYAEGFLPEDPAKSPADASPPKPHLTGFSAAAAAFEAMLIK